MTPLKGHCQVPCGVGLDWSRPITEFLCMGYELTGIKEGVNDQDAAEDEPKSFLKSSRALVPPLSISNFLGKIILS